MELLCLKLCYGHERGNDKHLRKYFLSNMLRFSLRPSGKHSFSGEAISICGRVSSSDETKSVIKIKIQLTLLEIIFDNC